MSRNRTSTLGDELSDPAAILRLGAASVDDRADEHDELLGEVVRNLRAAGISGGPLVSTKIGKTRVIVFEIDADGDAIAATRMSRDEDGRTDGTTMWGHVDRALRFARRRELRVRWLIITLDNSGARPPLHRPDFQLIRGAMRHGWVAHVIYGSVDRLTRSMTAGEYILRLIVLSRCKLWICAMERAVTAAEDMDMLVQQMSAQQNYKLIITNTAWGRMAKALSGRVIQERFLPQGFKLGRKGMALQNLKEWCWIEKLFELAADPGPPGSVRNIEAELKRLFKGCTWTHNTITKIIDGGETYNTGVVPIRCDGEIVGCQQVRLKRQVPMRRIRMGQHIKDNRAGTATRIPAGFFLLRGVPTVWMDRLGETNDEARSLLEGEHAKRGSRDRASAYWAADRGDRTWQDAGFAAEKVHTAVRTELARVMVALPDSYRLGPDEKRRLDVRLLELRAQQEQSDALVVDHMRGRTVEEKVVLAAFRRFSSATERAIGIIERRQRVAGGLSDVEQDFVFFDRNELIERALEVLLSDSRPGDEKVRHELVRCLLRSAIGKVRVYGSPEDFRVELEGPAREPGDVSLLAVYPLQAMRGHLEADLAHEIEYKAWVRERESEAVGTGATGPHHSPPTAPQDMPRGTVGGKPDPRERWPFRATSVAEVPSVGEPAWCSSELPKDRGAI